MAKVTTNGKYTYTASDDIEMFHVLRESLSSPRCSDEEAGVIQSLRILHLEACVEKIMKSMQKG